MHDTFRNPPKTPNGKGKIQESPAAKLLDNYKEREIQRSLQEKQLKTELEQKIKEKKNVVTLDRQKQIKNEQEQLIEVRDLFKKQDEFVKNKHRYMERLKKQDLAMSKDHRKLGELFLMQTSISRERL
jgi:hypothetical protein